MRAAGSLNRMLFAAFLADFRLCGGLCNADSMPLCGV